MRHKTINAKPLKISISPASISSGCYKIAVKEGTPKAPIFLCLGSEKAKLDITKGYSKSNLPGLLKVIDKNGLWGTKVKAFAVNEINKKIDPGSKSNTIPVALPVEPYKGNLSLDDIGRDSNLKYTGIRDGRMLHTTKINGWHLIKYGGHAETDPKKRGLNCITYVGGAYGKESGMNGYGTKLAQTLSAKKCDMECKHKKQIVEFFSGKGKSGTYIMWDEKHVVVVKSGVVYEFAKSKNGFAKTGIKSWGFSSRPYWVRKL